MSFAQVLAELPTKWWPRTRLLVSGKSVRIDAESDMGHFAQGLRYHFANLAA